MTPREKDLSDRLAHAQEEIASLQKRIAQLER